jgi:hypothetical protein
MTSGQSDTAVLAFERAMRQVYQRAVGEVGYTPVRFAQMLSTLGGVETARNLLRSSSQSEGFTKLWEAGRLDLTVEYQVLVPDHQALFTEEEIETARRRLLTHGMSADDLPDTPSGQFDRRVRRSGELASQVIGLFDALAEEWRLQVGQTEASRTYRQGLDGPAAWVQPQQGKIILDVRSFKHDHTEAEAARLRQALQSLTPISVNKEMAGIPFRDAIRSWNHLKSNVLTAFFGVGSKQPDGDIGDLDTSPQSRVLTMIARGESSSLELKSSARWNYSTKNHDKAIEDAIVKSVAGFMNAASGGTLLIGIDDDGHVLGVEVDYKTIQPKGRDGFENWLTTLLGNRLGKPSLTHVGVSFVDIDGHDVCTVDVTPSPRPVFDTYRNDVRFFVRFNNSTRQLNTAEVLEYQERRWRR